MEKHNLKKEIVEAGIKRQESIVHDFRQRIKDLLATEGNVNEEEYDSHQQSFKAESIAEVNLLNDELEFASKELDELRKVEGFGDHRSERAGYGSVVETDDKTFFVSASLEEFKANGNSVFGISINTPIYQAMKGKTIGESFFYAGRRYKIQNIF